MTIYHEDSLTNNQSLFIDHNHFAVVEVEGNNEFEEIFDDLLEAINYANSKYQSQTQLEKSNIKIEIRKDLRFIKGETNYSNYNLAMWY